MSEDTKTILSDLAAKAQSKWPPGKEDARPGAVAVVPTKEAPGYNLGAKHKGGDTEQPFPSPEGIAVASPVNEEVEHAVAAVEYDPDAKPPVYKNRRFRLYTMMCCVLVTFVVASGGVILAILLSSKDGEDTTSIEPPIINPVRSDREVELEEYLGNFVGLDDLRQPGSAHQKAFDWIVNVDRKRLNVTHSNLLQRYMLAFFYYSTTVDGPWRSCNPPNSVETADCLDQRIIVTVPEFQYKPFPGTRWLSGRGECRWAGVTCDGVKNVVGVKRVAQTLSGNIPSELVLLPFLQTLWMSYNGLSGSLPSEMGDLAHLRELVLNDNELTGSIPEEWYYDMVSINRLELTRNTLTGTIATEIAQMSLLKYVELNQNIFRGTLPSEIGELTNLIELGLSRNELSGTIPEEFGRLSNLHTLDLFFNEMEGSLPDTLYELTNLVMLRLYDNLLTGTLSTRIGQLSNIRWLNIRGNDITGTIPTEVGLLHELRSLWVHHTELTGSMPDEVCDLQHVFDEVIADCLPTGQTDPVVTCDCCTVCCNEENICEKQR